LTLPAFVSATSASETNRGDAGFTAIFDGQSLEGWAGDPDLWRVEDGAIVGQTTEQHPARHNTFLIWQGGQVRDFELKLEFKIRNHNSGIQYRAFALGEQPHRIGGYQADLDAEHRWTGGMYGEQFRGILARPGEAVVVQANQGPKVIGSVADPTAVKKRVNEGGWNTYHIIAEGYAFIHKVNGQVVSVTLDRDTGRRREAGLLGFQLHRGQPMKVQFRNIRIKRLSKDAGREAAQSPSQ
jgi:hypothetical protein